MTGEIAFVLAVLGVAVLLFVSDRIRPDLVALFVLLALTLGGVLTPDEAISGFSNPATITVWAVFILSGALYRTGVAGAVGRQILPLARDSQSRLVALLMLTAALLSAFMNNVAVVALMLPATMDLAKRGRWAASRLLIPLSFASLLGGMMTLIGTPPNILVSDAMRAQGLEPFGLFDYVYTGVPAVLVGVLFMGLVGRKLLPDRDVSGVGADAPDLAAMYAGHGSHFVLQLGRGSPLEGYTLAQSRLGAALGMNVLAIQRRGQYVPAPPPDSELRSGDRLIVEGQADRLEMLRGHRPLRLSRDRWDLEEVIGSGIAIAEVRVTEAAKYAGATLRETGLRDRYGLVVLAIRREGAARESELADTPVEIGDVLLIGVARDRLRRVEAGSDLALIREMGAAQIAADYHLDERLVVLQVPAGSAVAGTSLGESRVGDAFGLAILIIRHPDRTEYLPEASAVLREGDQLVALARLESLRALRALRSLEVVREVEADLASLESARIGLASVVLSPYSRLAGRTLRGLHFREKFGLNVVAIWRAGEAITTDLRDTALRFGDALLLHGPRDRLAVLASDHDFLVLTEAAQTPPRLEKAPFAIAIMGLAFLVPLALGLLSAPVAAVLAAALVVLAGCVTMDEAYRFIEWKAVFLIAGMLPLGLAMEKTGAATFIANQVIDLVGAYGPYAVMTALFLLTSAASQIMPSAASAVLIAPIAIQAANVEGLSPPALAMTVAVAASASFMSPIGHPSNILVMGPGGYRFGDYLRVGIPLTVVVLLVTLLVLPLKWPLLPPP